MSYTLLLVHAPPGSSDADVEQIALMAAEAEETRMRAAPDPDAERRKRALVEALLANCPELEGGAPDYAALARAGDISEAEARRRYRWWTVAGPDEGAGIEITLYDSYVSIDMPASSGTEQDWEDVWQYLEVLVREGGYVVWDPQGPNVVDLEAGPFGDRKRKTRRKSSKRPTKAAESDDESEDTRRGGEIGKLINGIVDDAIREPLAAAGFHRSGRTWRRQLDDGAIQVLNVQWSPRNAGVEGWLTLNAGVYFPALVDLIGEFALTTTPKEYECHVRIRPLPPGRDGWTVRLVGAATPDSDVKGLLGNLFSWLDKRADGKAPAQHARATQELHEAVEKYAFPWFERVSTLNGARDELLRRGPAFWGAHVSLALGEREEAARILQRELAKAAPEYAETLRTWGRRHGLVA